MARRFRVKGRFYVMLFGAILVLAVIIALILSSRNAGMIRAGTMKAELTATAVFIRDEKCVETEKYDRISFYADEGAHVYEGDLVADVYKWGYSDDMMQALLTVDGQIYSAQSALLAGVENAELAGMELQIAQKRLAIRSLALGGDDGDMLTLQRELKTLLEARAGYLSTTVQPTSALTELYATQTERTAQINTYKLGVNSVGDGTVSFYFDGYEQILNRDKLDTVNASVISSAASGTSDLLSGASNNMVYRLINTDLWYIAFVTPKSQELRLSAGEQYNVSFDELGETSFAGTAMTAAVSDGGILNIIEITEDMGELIRTRKLKTTVTAELDGFIVPDKYVGIKEGVAYVKIDGGDAGDYTVEVEVVAQEGDNSLIRALSTDGTLGAGMRCKKP